MNTSSFLALAAGGLSLLGGAVAEVSLPTVMNRSNSVYSLYEAAAARAPEVIAARLSEGVAVNLPDEQGNTALHIAARANDNDCVQLLLSGGADPMAKDAQGRIPSQLTTAEDCRMNLARAEALRAQEIALGESILRHDLRAVHQALRARLNPSAFAGDGVNTFLMLAVRENQPEIVEALLSAGADVKLVSPEGQYGILHVAVQSRRADMIPALLWRRARTPCRWRPTAPPRCMMPCGTATAPACARCCPLTGAATSSPPRADNLRRWAWL